MKLQTAKWWQDRFAAGLLLNGFEEDSWTWIGKDRNWVYLMWLEDGLSYQELEKTIQHDNE